MAKSLMDNKETVTKWEKLIRSGICIGILVVMVV